MGWTQTVTLFLGMLTLSLAAGAAIPSQQKKPQPEKILSGSAAATGGLAGAGFSIQNITWAKIAQKERVIIDMGDLAGKDIRGFPGYYHAELQENPSRLILDFSQTPNSLLAEADVRAKLKSSQKVSSSRLLVDPTDQTLSLILDLKKGTKAQIFQVKGQKGTSRVVVDLQ